MSYIIGVDTGLRGAMATIDKEGSVVDLINMPIITAFGKIKYDFKHLVKILKDLISKLSSPVTMQTGTGSFVTEAKKITIVIEETFPMPKILGGSSIASWSLGAGYMLIIGMVEMLECPYDVVAPRTWQREFFKGKVGESKLLAYQTALRLFPGVELSRTNREGKTVMIEGRSDALLIAEYYRRKLLGLAIDK